MFPFFVGTSIELISIKANNNYYSLEILQYCCFQHHKLSAKNFIGLIVF